MTYYTDNHEPSEAETLAIQLQKMDKNDPEYAIVQEEYYEALENERDIDFSEMLKKVMR